MTKEAHRRPTVLIVDDDADTRELYVMTLSSEDFEPLAAADGAEGCRLAGERQVDLVVTDLSLPRLDGWGLVACLRRDASTRHIPVVVLTGHSNPELRERAAREGCAALLVKPCLPDQLTAEVRRAIAAKGSDHGHVASSQTEVSFL
jgi:CheY-like chemotaxis protein